MVAGDGDGKNRQGNLLALVDFRAKPSQACSGASCDWSGVASLPLPLLFLLSLHTPNNRFVHPHTLLSDLAKTTQDLQALMHLSKTSDASPCDPVPRNKERKNYTRSRNRHIWTADVVS